MELSVDQGGEHPDFGKVTKRLKDNRENTIGTFNDKPMLYSRMHEVEYYNGSKQTFQLT